MQFGHIELMVESPSASLPFYRDALGFEVVAVQGEQFIWLKSGSTEILLRPGQPGTSPGRYADGRSGLVLYTSDLEGTMQTLESRGVTFTGNDGSERCPTFTDPDGNWFQLVDPRQH